jgi:L-threonylcarbamoyladenylate synthase
MFLLDKLDDPKLTTALRQGGVGVIPTDTVYGLVCAAQNQAAVARLYQLKTRENKPGTVIAASTEQLIDLGIPRRYLTAVEHFWPNSISIIVASTPALQYLDLGKMSLAVRIPADTGLRSLLEKTGPLLTTSANRPGEKVADTVSDARKYFGEQVDFYVDGGDLSSHPPSTIIKVIDDEVVVLREGAVKINDKGEISDI